MRNKDFYSLGYRDALALVLMEAWKTHKAKLPWLAQEYKEKVGEHPSLTFHLNK